jgi:hypothetical protein
MKYSYLMILSFAVLFLCSCSTFYSKQSDPAPVATPKPLAIPVGKNWQIVEEAPKLSDESGRLPFQKEQSVQPEGPKAVSPEDNRKIETPSMTSK